MQHGQERHKVEYLEYLEPESSLGSLALYAPGDDGTERTLS